MTLGKFNSLTAAELREAIRTRKFDGIEMSTELWLALRKALLRRRACLDGRPGVLTNH